MDNEKSFDENYSELKKMLSLWNTTLDYERVYQPC